MLFSKELGFYQIAIIVSRCLGLFRDVLVISVFGLSAQADKVFFLFSFGDLVMSVAAGGGVAVYLRKYIESSTTNEAVVLSGVLFYAAFAVSIILFEVLSNNMIGNFFFPILARSADIHLSYTLVLFSLVFGLSVAPMYTVFYRDKKLYLIPVANIIYSTVLVVGCLLLYLSDEMSMIIAGKTVILAALCRILFVYKKTTLKKEKGLLVFKVSFYRDMLLSGGALGLLLVVSYYIRSSVAGCEDGTYSSLGIGFKIVDAVIALAVIPLVMMAIRSGGLINRIAFTSIVASIAILAFMASYQVGSTWYLYFSIFLAYFVLTSTCYVLLLSLINLNKAIFIFIYTAVVIMLFSFYFDRAECVSLDDILSKCILLYGALILGAGMLMVIFNPDSRPRS